MFQKEDTPFQLSSKDIPNLVSLLHSINEIKIGLEGVSPQRAKAYICTLHQAGDVFFLHIFLFLLEQNSFVSYRVKEGSFAPEQHKFVEEKALDFLERMGFMMDNLNIQSFSIAEREELLQKIPIFSFQSLKKENLKTVTDPNVTELEEFFGDPNGERGISEKTDPLKVQNILKILASY